MNQNANLNFKLDFISIKICHSFRIFLVFFETFERLKVLTEDIRQKRRPTRVSSSKFRIRSNATIKFNRQFKICKNKKNSFPPLSIVKSGTCPSIRCSEKWSSGSGRIRLFRPSLSRTIWNANSLIIIMNTVTQWHTKMWPSILGWSGRGSQHYWRNNSNDHYSNSRVKIQLKVNGIELTYIGVTNMLHWFFEDI